MSNKIFGDAENIIKWIPWKNLKIFSDKKPHSIDFRSPISLRYKKEKNRKSEIQTNKKIYFPLKVLDPVNSPVFEQDLEVCNKKEIKSFLKDSETEKKMMERSGPHWERTSKSLNKAHSTENHPRRKFKKFKNFNKILFSFHSRSPTDDIKLTQSISRKVLFPPILKNQSITLTPNPKFKSKINTIVSDAIMNTDTYDEDSWLESKYWY